MPYDPNIHHRRSVRLQGYDYSRGGAYFITICTQDRTRLLGEIIDGQMSLSAAGQMIEEVWAGLPMRFPTIVLDAFVVMPDHLHGVLILSDETGEPNAGAEVGNVNEHAPGTLPGTIGRILQTFKSTSTHFYIQGVRQQGWPPFAGRLWQRNYYERIIRNEQALERIRTYINANPSRWAEGK
jgi:putative transposase